MFMLRGFTYCMVGWDGLGKGGIVWSIIVFVTTTLVYVLHRNSRIHGFSNNKFLVTRDCGVNVV